MSGNLSPADQIREQREALYDSQADAAAAAGMDRNTWAKIERGERASRKKERQAARALDWSGRSIERIHQGLPPEVEVLVAPKALEPVDVAETDAEIVAVARAARGPVTFRRLSEDRTAVMAEPHEVARLRQILRAAHEEPERPRATPLEDPASPPAPDPADGPPA